MSSSFLSPDEVATQRWDLVSIGECFLITVSEGDEGEFVLISRRSIGGDARN